MSDKFTPLPLPSLLALTLSELSQNRFMGIPGSLFFRPEPSDPFRLTRYGKELETPVGVAAGPHTQLAVNIIAAWLCGARYIELKTVQTLDELEVSKPCIDMQDEGYNCEWSQELRIEESFREYMNAWIIIHILHRELGFDGEPGTIFNMSVGYNLEGILKDNVQWFFEKMEDCSAELAEARNSVRAVYPGIDQVDIPARISGSITLSTMHGCPPDEIGKIGLYLVSERNLHTTIKLNPTLLGAEGLRQLLNGELGFLTQVPNLAFEHDLKYPDALEIIRSLWAASAARGLHFSIKLTNTLESRNNKPVFSEKEQMMYMSGRALHPVSIRLARKLQNDFGGKLDISFSAGVDCYNIADVIACGLKPATVCSDLLKPGGYGRLWQYIRNLRQSFCVAQATSIASFSILSSGLKEPSTEQACLHNLNHYADSVHLNKAYHKVGFTDPSIKTIRPLDLFDCIHAPCEDTCPTHQGIPEYMRRAAEGNFSAAFRAIMETNPFPSVTGMVCDHLCQLKCTRINYDEALHIREIKRFVAENTNGDFNISTPQPSGKKAAIIGAGPSGLSCAWFLAQAGVDVTVYEQKSIPGGMVSAAIPAFRLTGEAIERDIRRILSAGVKLVDNFRVDKQNFGSLMDGNDAVFLAAGAQSSAKLELEGIDAHGVLDPLDFLYKVRKGEPAGTGKHIVIIGGGNTAMDAARTAFRLAGSDGKVTILYRRTLKEMPADKGEIQAVLDEGIEIIELANPEKIIRDNGAVRALSCSRNVLAMKGKDGRPAPVRVPDSEFEIRCDTLIPAIGQQLAIDFLEADALKTLKGSYKTNTQKLYIGGDALRGASTAINAIADGRLAAAEMLADLDLAGVHRKKPVLDPAGLPELLHRKSVREKGFSPAETPFDDRQNFNLVISAFDEETARKEASRCLRCDEICNVCVSVCPNLANFSYVIDPVEYRLNKAVLDEKGNIRFDFDCAFRVDQPHQVLNIRDLCNECANCETFCPSSGRPYQDKPGLCLNAQTLNGEHEGYMLSRLPGRDVLIYKHNESIRTLTLQNGKYRYETDQVEALINPGDFSLEEVKFLTSCVKECRFDIAAQMSIIMKGAMQLAL